MTERPWGGHDANEGSDETLQKTTRTLFLSRNLFLQMRISLSHFRTSVPLTISWLVSRRQMRKRTCELSDRIHEARGGI